jgi:DNA-binding CsgD family transcriptional regulator
MTTETPHVPRLPPATERVVRELVREGMPNAVLAAALNLSEQTIKAHLAHAMRISRTQTRTALALWWIRRGQYQQQVGEVVVSWTIPVDEEPVASSLGLEHRQRIAVERRRVRQQF